MSEDQMSFFSMGIGTNQNSTEDKTSEEEIAEDLQKEEKDQQFEE